LNGYSVETYAGTPNRQDLWTDRCSRPNSIPIGLAKNTEGGLMVADLGNRALRHIPTTPRLAKIKARALDLLPSITAWRRKYISTLTAFTNIVFNNDPLIHILAEPNTETFYTFGPPQSFEADTIPLPIHRTACRLLL
jgi:hypothetical protein